MKVFLKVSMLLGLLFIGTSSLYAQNDRWQREARPYEPNKINGQVLDSLTNQPLIGASIFIKSLTDSVLTASVTDNEGRFELMKPRRRELLLEISYIGYTKIQNKISQQGSIDLGTILLAEDSQLLGEVVVDGQVPIGEMKGDTLVFNAAAFQTRENAFAEELIKKLPGVIIENGRIEAQGETVSKILVDGREFFGNDPNIALKNLPADMIDQIEILDQQSDQTRLTGLDDGNYAKTINIITKSNMRNGYFGRVNAGYGTDQRYMAGGNLNIFKGDKRISILGLSNNINQQNFSSEDLLGLSTPAGGGRGRRGGGGGNFLTGPNNGIATTNSMGLNYSDRWGKKINFTGSYFVNSSQTVLSQITNTETIVSEEIRQFYLENQLNNTRNYNHRANARIEYDINDKNALIIAPSISFQGNDRLSNRDALNLGGTLEPLSQISTLTDAFSSGFNLGNNLTYRYKFEKKGRTFSTNLNTSFNDRNSFRDLLIANTDFGNNMLDSTMQETQTFSSGFNYRTNVTYTEPLNDKSILSFNYQIGNNKSISDQKTFIQNEQGIMLLDSALSNVFDNKFITQKAGVGYRYSNKGFNVNLGLDQQMASIDNTSTFPEQRNFTRDFYNLLPSAVINFRSRETGSMIRFRYQTSTREPGINQLQNVINNSNPLQLNVGNPDLGQSFAHDLNLSYGKVNIETSRSFFVQMSAGIIDNFIGSQTFVAQRDTLIQGEVLLRRGGQISQPINLSGNWNARINFNYGSPIPKLKSNFNSNTSARISSNPGLINGQKNYNENIALTQRFSLTSNVSKDLDFTLSSSGTYNIINSSLQTALQNNFYVQNTNFQLYYSPNNGKTFFNSTAVNSLYSGLSEGFNQSIWLWNIEAGYRFLKNNKGELKLTVFDVLGENTSISRTVSDVSISDVNTNVLSRYGLLTFSYIIGNFKRSEAAGSRMLRPTRGGARSW